MVLRMVSGGWGRDSYLEDFEIRTAHLVSPLFQSSTAQLINARSMPNDAAWWFDA